MQKLLLSVLVLFIGIIAANELQDVPTYFATKNKRGEAVDAMDKRYWIKINRIDDNEVLGASASLKVQPSIVSDGGWVNVSWYGIQLPTVGDFVAYYCPQSAKDNDYLDYFYANVSPSYEKGTGQYSVQLFNIRTNCEFRYFRGISEKYALLATSNTVMFQGGPEQPLQIHLALTGDPTQMRVMWVSGTDEKPVVTFYKTESHTLTAVGTSQTYSGKDLCFLNGKFIDPGYIHDVLLINLEPSTTYYYTCGVPGHMSEVRSFKSALPIGSNVGYKFIVFGDHGLSPAAHQTAKYVTKDINSGDYDFIFHNGDISYARGYEYIWDQWHSLIQPYASKVPYMIGIGNHEQDHIIPSHNDLSVPDGKGFLPTWGNYGDDSNGECGVPMYYRFHMPDNGNHVWWYSYNYGMVHFIMMSTEHDMAKGSPQYTWLENDLKNIDRTKTPWVILGGHRPMYTSEIIPGDYFVSVAIQHLLEDLIHEYQVDLAFWAHYHSYERTCAMYKHACLQEQGTVHIVIGTAGKSEDEAAYFHTDWSLARRHKDPYGYGRVTIANHSALHWEYFVNSEEKVVDQVWLFKQAKAV